MGFLVYLSVFITFFGLFLMTASRHALFQKITPSIQRLPRRVQRQFTLLIMVQLKNNPVFNRDHSRITQDLADFRLRGKPVTFLHFFALSIFSAILFCVFSFFTTTRQFQAQFVSLSTANHSVTNHYVHSMNLPADVLMFFIGLTIPRFLLLISRVKTRFKYQNEASQSFYLLTNSIRTHPNIDKAIVEAVPRLPPATRKLFNLALSNWYSAKFKNLKHVLFWIAEETRHPYWKEFATIVMTENTTGLKDLYTRMTILTNRADSFHGLQQDARKSLKWQLIKVGIPTILLIILFLTLTFVDKADGFYLYMTPVGKLLISLIYFAVAIIILIFYWNYYQV